MQLDFVGLQLENFGCFTNTQQLNFADLEPGTYYVHGWNKVEPTLGANGAGKSTMFNGLYWCLFGTTPNGLHSTDLKPWDSNETTRVGLVIKVDGKKHTILRYARPNSLTIDGKDATQDAVIKLIGMSGDVFEQTILLGQGRPLFHDLANRDKLQLLSDVLQLDRWENYSTKASKDAGASTINLSRAEGELHSMTARAQELKQQWADMRDKVKEWEAQKAHKIDELETKHEKQSHLTNKLKTQFANLDVQHDEADLHLSHCSADLDKFEKVTSAVRADLFRNKLMYETQSKEWDKLETSIEELRNGKTCPTCGQAWLKGHTAATHIKDLTNESYKLKAKIFATQALKKELVKKEQAATDKVNEFIEHESNYKKKRDQLGRDRALLKTQLSEHEYTLRDIVKQMEHWEAEGNPYRATQDDLKTKQTKAQQQVKEIEEDIAILTRRIERSKFWIKGFKDVRLHVLDDVLQELELVTNAMLDEVGLVGWSVHYSVERETKSGTTQRGLMTTVTSPKNNKAVKWASWSGGEAQRLRLVGALALSQVLLGRAGVEPNIEILDEPTSHLSTEGVDFLCAFLATRARDLNRQVFFIDHMAMDSSQFTGSIQVTKTAKGSLVEVL